MKKLIIFESILILFFVLAWNVSKAGPMNLYCEMYSKEEHRGMDIIQRTIDIGEKAKVFKLDIERKRISDSSFEYPMEKFNSETKYNFHKKMRVSDNEFIFFGFILNRYTLELISTYQHKKDDKDILSLVTKFNCKEQEPKI